MARRFALVLCAALVAAWLATPPALAQTPKRGGIVRIADREAPNLDPHLAISFLTHSWASMVYGQLVRYPHGPEQKHPADFAIVPDLAEKWEYKSPTVIEFTLRKGVKFHNKPPVNGREVTADDVKYSIERFMAKSGFRARFEVGPVHRRRRPLHPADHPEGALGAVPEPPGRLDLRGHPAPRGRGEVQGLQPAGGDDRYRPLHGQVLPEGRADHLRAEPRLPREGVAVPGRGRDRDHPRVRRPPVDASRGQGGTGAHVGLPGAGGGQVPQADEPGDGP